MVPNHPECRRWLLGVTGPAESRHKVIITKDRDGEWNWRYKYKGRRDYIRVGPVRRFSSLEQVWQEIRILELVRDIY
jgi:hypothetical protein